MPAALQEVLAGPQSELYGALPKVALSGDDWLMRKMAQQLLTILRDKGLYRRDAVVVFPYEERRRLELMESKTFRTWVEEFCVCYKTRWDKEGEPFDVLRTMPKEMAEGVLFCKDFWQGLWEIERCHPVRMPVLKADGSIGLLPEGYDAESKTLTFV